MTPFSPDATMTPVTIVPANEASWEDLQAVLGARGYHSGCWCQRFKMRGREWDSESLPVEERAPRLRAQTDCGHPESGTTSGLVAYLDGEPAGWCAVEPRTAYVRLGRTPLGGKEGFDASSRSEGSTSARNRNARVTALSVVGRNE